LAIVVLPERQLKFLAFKLRRTASQGEADVVREGRQSGNDADGTERRRAASSFTVIGFSAYPLLSL